jgi:hypothetical protein
MRLTDPKIIEALEKGKHIVRADGKTTKVVQQYVRTLGQEKWETGLGELFLEELRADDWEIVE